MKHLTTLLLTLLVLGGCSKDEDVRLSCEFYKIKNLKGEESEPHQRLGKRLEPIIFNEYKNSNKKR